MIAALTKTRAGQLWRLFSGLKADSIATRLSTANSLKGLESVYAELGGSGLMLPFTRKLCRLLRHTKYDKENSSFIFQKLLNEVAGLEGPELVEYLFFIRYVQRNKRNSADPGINLKLSAYYGKVQSLVKARALSLPKLCFVLLEYAYMEKDVRACLEAIATALRQSPQSIKELSGTLLCKAIAQLSPGHCNSDCFFLATQVVKLLEGSNVTALSLQDQAQLLHSLGVIISKMPSLQVRKQLFGQLCKSLAGNIAKLTDSDILRIIESFQHLSYKDESELIELIRKTFYKMLSQREVSYEQARISTRYLEAFSRGSHLRFNEKEQEAIICFLRETIAKFPHLYVLEQFRDFLPYLLFSGRLSYPNRQLFKEFAVEKPRFIWQIQFAYFFYEDRIAEYLERFVEAAPDYSYNRQLCLFAYNEEKLGPKTRQYVQANRARFEEQLDLGFPFGRYTSSRLMLRPLKKVAERLFNSLASKSLPLSKKINLLVRVALSAEARSRFDQFLKSAGLSELSQQQRYQIRVELLTSEYSSFLHFLNLMEVFKLIVPENRFFEVALKLMRQFERVEDAATLIFQKLQRCMKLVKPGEASAKLLARILQQMQKDDQYSREQVIVMLGLVSKYLMTACPPEEPSRDVDFIVKLLVKYGELTPEAARFFEPFAYSMRNKQLIQAKVSPDLPPTFAINHNCLHIVLSYPYSTIASQLAGVLGLIEESLSKRLLLTVLINCHRTNLQSRDIQTRIEGQLARKNWDLSETLAIIDTLQTSTLADQYESSLTLMADRLRTRFEGLERNQRIKVIDCIYRTKLQNSALIAKVREWPKEGYLQLKTFFKLLCELNYPPTPAQLALIDKYQVAEFEFACAYYFAGRKDEARKVVLKGDYGAFGMRLLAELLDVPFDRPKSEELKLNTVNLLLSQFEKGGVMLKRYQQPDALFEYFTVKDCAVVLTRTQYGKCGRLLGARTILIQQVLAKQGLTVFLLDFQTLLNPSKAQALRTQIEAVLTRIK